MLPYHVGVRIERMITFHEKCGKLNKSHTHTHRASPEAAGRQGTKRFDLCYSIVRSFHEASTEAVHRTYMATSLAMSHNSNPLIPGQLRSAGHHHALLWAFPMEADRPWTKKISLLSYNQS